MKPYLTLLTALALFAGINVAKSSCPCSPCHCSPCHCGGSHGGARIGVGFQKDLGGIGRQNPEGDPFAVPSTSSAGQTQEKHKSKSKDTDVAKSSSFNPFTGCQLTGGKAKTVALADTSYRSPDDQSPVKLNGTVGAVVPSEAKKTKP